RGPFDLQQALGFLRGFPPAGAEEQAGEYLAAHALNGRALLVRLREQPEAGLELAILGPELAEADLDAAERLARRIFSLDWDGDAEAERLLARAPAEARAWLEQSPGIGPWASEFVLIRGVGHPDLLPEQEPRLLESVRRHYGLDHPPSAEELARLGERWAPFRSWAAFLLRVALEADRPAAEVEPG